MKYVEECACDLTGGKDIRMYDLTGWLTAIFHREQATADGYVKHWENGYFAVNICDAAFCFIRDFGIYLYFIWKIINGNMAVQVLSGIQRLRQAVKRHAAHFLTAEKNWDG